MKGFAEWGSREEGDCQALGGKILTNYCTLSQYGFVIVVDLPSEEAMVKLLLEAGKWSKISKGTLIGMTPEPICRAAAET